MPTNPRLPHTLNTRLTADQWQLLETTADALDLTLSGAIRHHLDVVLDTPVMPDRKSPTRRELMHEERGEFVIGGQTVTIESITRAEAHADA
jgi:hypothetical protein